MIPAAPSQPLKNTVSAWNGQFALLENDLKKWVKRMEAGSLPLTNTEAVQLQSAVAAARSVSGVTNPNVNQLAAGAFMHADAAAAASLKTTVESLPAHVTGTVDEIVDTLGWKKYGNPQAMAAVVNGGIGQMTADWKSLSEQQRVTITQTVARAVALGKGPRETARVLTKNLGDDFAFGQARSLMISRTTMAAAYDQASSLTYQEAHSMGLIAGWEWIARPGACIVCYELHGNLFPAEQPPYRHPNCRCATSPVLLDDNKAKKQYFTGNENVELKTGKSGWTTWTPAGAPGKPAKPKKAPAPDQAPPAIPPHTVEVVGKGEAPDGDVTWQVHEHADGSVTGQAFLAKDPSNVLGEFYVDLAPGKAAKWISQQTGEGLPFAMENLLKQALMNAKPVKPDAPKPKGATAKPALNEPYQEKDGTWSIKDKHGTSGSYQISQMADGTAYATYNGKILTYQGWSKGWTYPDGKPSGKTLEANLTESLKVLLNKSKITIKAPEDLLQPKPKPKGSAYITGEVDSPKGTVKAVQNKNTKVITGTYDGDNFVFNDNGWIHKPTGTKAGPNSTEYLTQAATKAGIDLDAAKTKAREGVRSVATKEDEARAIAFKQAHPDFSPIEGVSSDGWRQAWDDVSDGHRLPSSVAGAQGWKTMWEQVKRYTSDYEKPWAPKDDFGNPVMNKRSRTLFKTAPAYVRPAYRGMKMGPDRPIPILEFVEKYPVGSTLDLRGGASFSFDASKAEGFAAWGRSDALIIEVRTGFTGIPVRGFSYHGHESEILVGSKLRVVEINQTPKGWHYVVEQEGMIYDE